MSSSISTINIVNVSGGKDSTATLLLALERQTPNLRAIFADTGHEHPKTYAYIAELEHFPKIKIDHVKADFTARIARRRAFAEANYPPEVAARALEVLHPTGNPFLDLCLWKGVFPSSGQRFCTEFLKMEPIREVQMAALETHDRVVSWLGVRADESYARSTAVEWQRDFGPPDQEEAGLWSYRPILRWSALEVFAYLQDRRCKPNPLYFEGMGRVGCMPCVMVRKSELTEIAQRFPEEIKRVAEWEKLVSQGSLRGNSTFIQAKTVRAFDKVNITHTTHGIEAAVEWAKTSRGGRQTQFMFEDGSGCSSVYGLCETSPPEEEVEP